MGHEPSLAEASKISHRFGFTFGRAFHVGPDYFVRLLEQLKIARRASWRSPRSGPGGLSRMSCDLKCASSAGDGRRPWKVDLNMRATEAPLRGSLQRSRCGVSASGQAALCAKIGLRIHLGGECTLRRWAVWPKDGAGLLSADFALFYLRGEGCAARSCSAPVF